MKEEKKKHQARKRSNCADFVLSNFGIRISPSFQCAQSSPKHPLAQNTGNLRIGQTRLWVLKVDNYHKIW